MSASSCQFFLGFALVLLRVICVVEACTCRSLRFDGGVSGQRLLNHVIDSKQASTDQWCRWFCLWNDDCVSVNYNRTVGRTNMYHCELNNANGKQFPGDVKGDREFTHYAAQNPCISSQCGKNELCQAGFDCGPGKYRCVCKPGYSGRTCEQSHFILPESTIIDSDININNKLKEYLQSVNVGGKQWKLCYRASANRYLAQQFHVHCDNKGPTVTLIQVGANHTFGGYTDASWDRSAGWIYSNSSFLFTLKNDLGEQHKMPVYQSKGKALFNSNMYGPSFGVSDLVISDRCNKNSRSYSDLGKSYKLPNGFTKGDPRIDQLLAGSRNFFCSEYEVFYQE